MAKVKTNKVLADLKAGDTVRRLDGHLYEVTITAEKASREGECLIAKRITQTDNYKKENDKNAGRFQLFENDIDWEFLGEIKK